MMALLDSAQIIVCMGSGGVGKTTLAAAMGLLSAQRGRRVLVLTIDPSQRLKTTLGLKETGEISIINDIGLNIKGSLSAAVINSKKVFDDFVRKTVAHHEQDSTKNSTKDQLVNKIMQNKLYQQLSTTLSGSQEFTALERLMETYESNNYDLIVLDTPPAQHAIDFLYAPQKLAALFNERIAKWFRESEESNSFITRLVNSGTTKVLRALEVLTGSEFLNELRNFFQNFRGWQLILEERVASVHRLLMSDKTHFALITGFDSAKLKEAHYFLREIKKGGYHLSSIIINRSQPHWLLCEDQSQKQKTPALTKLYCEMKQYYQLRNKQYRTFSQNLPPDLLYQVPELSQDISEIESILEVAQLLAKERPNDV